MAKSKVTAKFQVTIPSEVREGVGMRPGELVEVEAGQKGEVIIKRFGRSKVSLGTLIGQRTSKRHIPVKELEEAVESR